MTCPRCGHSTEDLGGVPYSQVLEEIQRRSEEARGVVERDWPWNDWLLDELLMGKEQGGGE